MSDDKEFRNPSPPPEVVKAMKAMIGESIPITPLAISRINQDSDNSIISRSFHALHSGADQLLAKASSPKSRKEAKDGESSASQPEGKKPPVSRRESSTSDYSDDEVEDDRWRHDMFDSGTDYYCDMCKAHMNSDLTWQSHVEGKKHQKKMAAVAFSEPGRRLEAAAPAVSTQPIKLLPGGPPAIRTIKKHYLPRIQPKIDSLDTPCVGLSFVTEIQKPEPELEPVYYCYLCSSQCVLNTVLNHIIGYKHRMGYLKHADMKAYDNIKWKQLKKSELSLIAEGHARRLEKRDGSGKMMVEVENPYGTFPWEKEDYMEQPRSESSMQPLFPVIQSSEIPRNLHALPPHTRTKILKELSRPFIQNQEEAGRLSNIIENFNQAVMNYKIASLNPGIRAELSKSLLSGDTRSLERAFGVGDSSRNNTNAVLKSMMSGNNYSGQNFQR